MTRQFNNRIAYEYSLNFTEDFFVMILVLQGHISFPLVLDVFPFMTTRQGVKIQDIDVQSLPLNLQYERRSSLPNHHNLQSERRMLKFSGLHGAATEQISSDDLIDDGIASSTSRQALLSNTVFPCSEGSSESVQLDMHMQLVDEVGPIFFVFHVDAFTSLIALIVYNIPLQKSFVWVCLSDSKLIIKHKL